MTELHDDLADRLDRARRRLVEEYLEASRPPDRGRETIVARLLGGLKTSLRVDPTTRRNVLNDNPDRAPADRTTSQTGT